MLLFYWLLISLRSNNYSDEYLSSLVSIRDVIEEKINIVTQLSVEIQDSLGDENYEADFDKYTDVEVELRCQLLGLDSFIQEKKTFIAIKETFR